MNLTFSKSLYAINKILIFVHSNALLVLSRCAVHFHQLLWGSRNVRKRSIVVRILLRIIADLTHLLSNVR